MPFTMHIFVCMEKFIELRDKPEESAFLQQQILVIEWKNALKYLSFQRNLDVLVSAGLDEFYVESKIYKLNIIEFLNLLALALSSPSPSFTEDAA